MNLDINDLWNHFVQDGEDNVVDYMDEFMETIDIKEECKEVDTLSISTKTMISYLNQPVDIRKVFWELPLIHYHETRSGIIKKQIKCTCPTKEAYNQLQDTLSKQDETIPCSVDTIKSIDDDTTFKYVCKINMGLCKKDLISYRSKKKSAFYNCFVCIIRIQVPNTADTVNTVNTVDTVDTVNKNSNDTKFKEIHVKVFNTGKMEIPGIQHDSTLYCILDTLCALLNTYTSMINVSYSQKEKDIQTVLINSNFHCGYTVNRQTLYERLKFKYHFNTLYDPCKYPGVQCKFYYKFNIPKEDQDGICHCETPCSKKGRPRNAPTGPCLELSFMVFRTGSILIVGNCRETILREIYETIATLMKDEKKHCMIQNVSKEFYKKNPVKPRNRKLKRRVYNEIWDTYKEEQGKQSHSTGLLYSLLNHPYPSTKNVEIENNQMEYPDSCEQVSICP